MKEEEIPIQSEPEIRQVATKPLDFDNQFLVLLAGMDGEIHRSKKGSDNWEKLIRYQTLIASGGYLGLRAKEFLNLTWSDIIGKTDKQVFQFKTKSKRKVYYSPRFINYVDRNFKLLNPLNIHNLVLHKKDDPFEPVSTSQFNQVFTVYVERYVKDASSTSSHTLRKTFMNELWKRLGGNEKAYITVAKYFNYRSIGEVRFYLGHAEEETIEAIVRFN